jgi:UDP-2-acetamido-3-amino-2,3-dideoxy-glucuronate N-acetyltransferase
MRNIQIHPSAEVHESASLGDLVKVWQMSHVRENVTIGSNSNIGRNVYIGPGVSIGDNCKVQNNSLIYEPAVLGDGVFIGPGVILTNDSYPRAVNDDGSIKGEKDWAAVGVVIEEGASIGANSVCIAPVKVGAWSLIGSGAVVTKDVIPYSLMVGNPARQIGWVGKAGVPLVKLDSGIYECPSSGKFYKEDNSNFFEIDESDMA